MNVAVNADKQVPVSEDNQGCSLHLKTSIPVGGRWASFSQRIALYMEYEKPGDVS